MQDERRSQNLFSAGQALSPHRIEGTEPMLARRFTIVCLLTTLFGMGLAMVVGDSDRASRSSGFDAVFHSNLR
ncbi:hypothetical protein GA830_11225 [Mesorhizobium sp. NBSH29]|nr:hypothetical protein GA830_11225 [Mesorhizobium sp. NBSH29]